MLTTIRLWLAAALPFLRTLAVATVWTDKDDLAVAWLQRFNDDPDAAIAEIQSEAGILIRLSLAKLLGWLEDHIKHTGTIDEVITWLHHIIVDPLNPMVTESIE